MSSSIFSRCCCLVLGAVALQLALAVTANDSTRERLLVAEVGRGSSVHHTTRCNTSIVGENGCVSLNGPGDTVDAPHISDFPFFESPYTTYPTDGHPWGIHLIGPYPDGTTYLVSWESGAPQVGVPTTFTHPTNVTSKVKLSTVKGHAARGRTIKGDFVTYQRSFSHDSGQYENTYLSPVINHVVLKALKPLTTYFYVVGDGSKWSSERNFTTLPNHKTPASKRFPLRIGLMADVGQTNNSTQTRAHIMANKPQVVINVGDYSYADNYGANDPNNAHNARNGSSQQRWDTMGVMWEPLFSHVPHLGCIGNHEVERGLTNYTSGPNVTSFSYPDNYPFQSYSARYPVPGTLKDFGNIDKNLYYSTAIGGAVKLITLNNYMPFHPGSPQYNWVVEELEGHDRAAQPWLFVQTHSSIYHTYYAHFKEMECFRGVFEDLFYEHGVDLVLTGHVHAYERTHPVYNYEVDTCAPVYITIGDGGNVEGPYRNFIDEVNPVTKLSYCEEVEWRGRGPNDVQAVGGGSWPVGWGPSYQREWHTYTCPTLSWQPAQGVAGGPVLNLLNSSFTNSSVPLGFCQSSQPVWSAYRDPSFGHGIIDLLSETVLKLSWYRNLDGIADAVDSVTLERLSACASRQLGKQKKNSRKLSMDR